MASSDDEREIVPKVVTNYYCVDENDEPISFVELPIQWSDGTSFGGSRKRIFLRGTSDDGLQNVYIHVTAWKVKFLDAKPEIFVSTNENKWIKLPKPRKSFELMIRTILITVHCLHFLSKNPEVSEKHLWDHLSKVFSTYEVKPSENDLVDHLLLINEAVEKEESLSKSKFLQNLKERPLKNKRFDEAAEAHEMSGFIVDNLEDETMDTTVKNTCQDDDDTMDGESDEEQMYETVCAICDEGGDILCCDGICMRSFHATVQAGRDSFCRSLRFTKSQVDAMPSYFCPNCQYMQHQCFACGKLGSSNKSSGAEVFRCVSATCGRFYHPHCVAKLLHRDNEEAAQELQKKIVAGESFLCPTHKCFVCKGVENKKIEELQFAVCRRCPKSYHRKCLPRGIHFEEDEEEGIVQRAWEDILPNRILIYCLKHEIDVEIGTPIRNHCKFPIVEERKKNRASESLLSIEKGIPRRKKLSAEDSFEKRIAKKASKQVEKFSSGVREGGLKKFKASDNSRKLVRENTKLASVDAGRPVLESGRKTLGGRLYELMKGPQAVSSKQDAVESDAEKPAMKKLISLPSQLDADSERRILTLMKESMSSMTLEDVVKKHKVPSTHSNSLKRVVDRTITHGKVEGAIEALRTAMRKLEDGCGIEEATAVCEPDIVYQIIRWQNKLKVYLAPFLHGMRYTSFGRHFTKVDKLEEIVHKLQWYVQNGDTLVDFCCGANDFSCLMKKKLDEAGKKCSFKNYDILRAKNDFNFEQKDWFEVRPQELPTGSQLIMGLNPPFGVKSALANKFIDKALQFKPKLIVLIVPPETQRLDEKKSPYDLVWEDARLLSGKSFYLPGSVDVNDKQIEQWNLTPPPLYLWSRPDWTAKHKAIAEKHGHIFSRTQTESHSENIFSRTQMESHSDNIFSRTQMESHSENIFSGTQMELHSEKNFNEKQPASDQPVEDCGSQGEISMEIDDPAPQNDEQAILERIDTMRARVESTNPINNSGGESHKKHGNRKKGPRRQSSSGATDLTSTADKLEETAYHSSPARSQATRSSFEGPPSTCLETPSYMDVGEEAYQQPTTAVRSSFEYGSISPDDIARRYSLNSEPPFSAGAHRRTSYADDLVERYRNPDIRSHVSPPLGQHFQRRGHFPGADPDGRSRISPPLGQHFPRGGHFVGADPEFSRVGPSSYGHLGSAPQSSASYGGRNMSATQRYAPRLDELNSSRASTLVPERPVGPSMGFYHTRPPPQPRYPGDLGAGGFASGIRHTYSRHNSSGWLNE